MVVGVKSSVYLKAALLNAPKQARAFVGASPAARVSWLAAFALMATDGVAADFSPATLAAPLVAQAHDWTGFYIGGHVGLATGHSDSCAHPLHGVWPLISDPLRLYK